ncbi:bifunctional hydroxymethylpyrimidine kinase/phosphomethylpyrimidine kinase [Vibrio vulnificus]|uniref:bifunctional hydroxymethylpyrimidine kinase/phosphomethylpyrimidine kinase n=1 Tax=Vibrio vulnificus TaxID=672 RepID=UPI001F03E032|nr:bifunctional hydroxymethylpyrimidine kinase/phosphomethylpyrimidine kinase [Vibrio vulnificus]MCG9655445.1 bifunctional hydroxymethylpyrimidine kinase/phosphomethylpyrimidine kinase [Vibrio vulnificus]
MLLTSTTQSLIPCVVTIAGSDSGGGAGIQADIKAISATGSYASSVITAITAQNTMGVNAVFPIPTEFVAAQLDAVFSDLNIQAVKIGMLADRHIIRLVAEKIRQYSPAKVVLDPVMISTSGQALLQPDAIAALKEHLIPLADIVTPNIPEYVALTGMPIPNTEHEMISSVESLKALNCPAILLKGGHLYNESHSSDLLITPQFCEFIRSKRHSTRNTHGTGCTLSSAIASYLAQGHRLHKAVFLAKQYISQAIAHADELSVGQGHGPVNHFFAGHMHVR